MIIDDIFSQRRKRWNNLISVRKALPDDVECPNCHQKISAKELEESLFVCPSCEHYFTVGALDRINMLSDEGSFKEMYRKLKTKDPIGFPDYEKKLEGNRRKTGLLDAVVAGTCKIGGRSTGIAVVDSRFLMGSMGTVVGEKITRIIEYSDKKKLPLIIVSASGGARMQEGLFSLMQMAKTSAAVEKFKSNGGLFISILTNPTTGGVSASYASLGDINIAEPNALICFAGPRVIEQTIGQKLPEGFQRAEFLLEHGMIDMIVERDSLRKTLANLLKLHSA